MSVYTHPNRPGWQMIKISHGRKEKAEYIAYPGSREEAQIYERELRGITDTSDPDWGDKMPEFRISYKNEVSAGTYTDFGWAWKQIEPFFKSMKLRHITPMIIEQYKAKRLAQLWKGKPISKRTVNRELSYLAKYLAFCGCTIKPVKFRKKDCTPPPPDILTMTEMITIISKIKPPVKHLVQLMVFNGLRRTEAFQLRSEDAREDGTQVRVLGKGNKWRMAPVSLPELQEAITEAKKARPDGYLFPNLRGGKHYGQPYTDIRKTLRPAGEGGKRLYNHLLRHSFATDMAAEDENIFVLQNLLGHADVKMTQQYVHLADKTMRRATARQVDRSVANVAMEQTQQQCEPTA